MLQDSRATSPFVDGEDAEMESSHGETQKGPFPIDEKRAQQLEDAHKRVWSAIARKDIPKVGSFLAVVASGGSLERD